jgi:hypothetical protein
MLPTTPQLLLVVYPSPCVIFLPPLTHYTQAVKNRLECEIQADTIC